MTADEMEQLIILYGKSIYSFCCHLTGSRQTADDLYQDTLLKAVELCHKLNSGGNAEELKSSRNYLIGIAVRLWKNQSRKNDSQRLDISLDDESNGSAATLSSMQDVEAEVENRELILKLRQSVNMLPEKLRVVIYMYYTVGMDIKEIAEELRIPQGTVKSRMHKARIKIMYELEASGYEI